VAPAPMPAARFAPPCRCTTQAACDPTSVPPGSATERRDARVDSTGEHLRKTRSQRRRPWPSPVAFTHQTPEAAALSGWDEHAGPRVIRLNDKHDDTLPLDLVDTVPSTRRSSPANDRRQPGTGSLTGPRPRLDRPLIAPGPTTSSTYASRPRPSAASPVATVVSHVAEAEPRRDACLRPAAADTRP
jgi:hypothetical protein